MLVLVICGLNSQKVLERWSFGVETDREVAASNGAVYFLFGRVSGSSKEKELSEIQREIQAIIRQITASMTFLPLLDEPCTCCIPLSSRLFRDSRVHEQGCRGSSEVGRQRSSLHSQRPNSETALLLDKRLCVAASSSVGPQREHCCNIQTKPYVAFMVLLVGHRIRMSDCAISVFQCANCNSIVCDSQCNILVNDELRIISADSSVPFR